MNSPQREFYSKPVTEVWIAFDCRGHEAKNRLLRECRTWGSCAILESLGYERVVLVVRPGGARELTR